MMEGGTADWLACVAFLSCHQQFHSFQTEGDYLVYLCICVFVLHAPLACIALAEVITFWWVGSSSERIELKFREKDILNCFHTSNSWSLYLIDRAFQQTIVIVTWYEKRKRCKSYMILVPCQACNSLAQMLWMRSSVKSVGVSERVINDASNVKGCCNGLKLSIDGSLCFFLSLSKSGSRLQT